MLGIFFFSFQGHGVVLRQGALGNLEPLCPGGRASCISMWVFCNKPTNPSRSPCVASGPVAVDPILVRGQESAALRARTALALWQRTGSQIIAERSENYLESNRLPPKPQLT
jgi:hypothetical protein